MTILYSKLSQLDKNSLNKQSGDIKIRLTPQMLFLEYEISKEESQDSLFSLLECMMKQTPMYLLEADMTQESVKVCLEQIQDSDERVEEVFIEFHR